MQVGFEQLGGLRQPLNGFKRGHGAKHNNGQHDASNVPFGDKRDGEIEHGEGAQPGDERGETGLESVQAGEAGLGGGVGTPRRLDFVEIRFFLAKGDQVRKSLNRIDQVGA